MLLFWSYNVSSSIFNAVCAFADRTAKTDRNVSEGIKRSIGSHAGMEPGVT